MILGAVMNPAEEFARATCEDSKQAHWIDGGSLATGYLDRKEIHVAYNLIRVQSWAYRGAR